MRLFRVLARWSPVLLASAVIFLLSSRSDIPDLGYHFPHRDKVAHVGIYGFWGFLFCASARRQWPGIPRIRGILLAALAGLVYGASDEIHQIFVPRRSADLADLGADVLGAFLGGWAHAPWLGLWSRRGP